MSFPITNSGPGDDHRSTSIGGLELLNFAAEKSLEEPVDRRHPNPGGHRPFYNDLLRHLEDGSSLLNT